ncbi:MAG: glycosyltransferase [Ruminococcaceae bacterium]|nr:glycosyltransferase [Oscillospiraceae bacterium]
MSNYKYKFSIISAVYNVELFLAEAIESILSQTIGLENIQLILINDGSEDGSAAICDEYAAKYPENIVVVHKENEGVSTARNVGLELIQGEFVNFMDSDDMLTPDTLERVYKLFSENYDKTDVVAIPLEHFDGATGGHILNYKFEQGTRIVDLNEEWNFIQMSSSSSFIKTAAIKGVTFDSRLAYGEDASFMQRVLVKKQTLGLEADARYMYRKRTTGAPSALQNSLKNPKWYIPSVKYFLKGVMDYAKEQLGYIPKFIQYVVMYDVQWRIRQRDFLKTDVITEEEKQEYVNILKEIISGIDEDVILCQNNLNRDQRIVALELKYDAYPEIIVDEEKNDVLCSFSEDTTFSLITSKTFFQFLDIKNGTLKIEGYFEICDFPFDSFDLSVCVNGEKINTTLTDRKSEVVFLTRNIFKKIGFTAELELNPATPKYEIKLSATINGKTIFMPKYTYAYFSPITREYRYSHYVKDNWLMTPTTDSILVMRCGAAKKFFTEFNFLLWIFKNNKNKSRKELFLRFWYHIAKRFNKKPIWLISDRPNVAGDNGEAFFRYMVAEHPEIDASFVINADSPDYKKMKKIGPVIKKTGFKHKLKVLLAEYIFSSQAENEHFDPFGSTRNAFRDILANKPFVFLQHGVTKDDLSSWLNRYNKNLAGFVVSANGEYRSILEYNYFYSADKVWLTGMPRFDTLYSDAQKTVSITPTWRKNLTSGRNSVTGGWNLITDFDKSEFFKFYDALINHPKIKKAVQETGYKVEFLLHPNLRDAAELFEKNEYVSIISTDINYNRLFASSDLIVTDYSSTVFDFVYLYKPVVYTHFDSDEFFGGAHSYQKGYFDYERDGFGEVEYELEATVDRIVEYMENGCKLKDKYRERIDNFFAFDDKNNSQRVYEMAVKHRKS